MTKFLLRIILFCTIGIVLGESIVRIANLTSDIPKRIIVNKIQKFEPLQTGKYIGGIRWETNESGWISCNQKSDKKIALIGDSYIENLMNPIECHQCSFLNTQYPKISFFQNARSGVTFIESLEIAKNLDNSTTIHKIIFVNKFDLTESIKNIKNFTDRTQIDVKKRKVVPGKIKSSTAKTVLYNFKFAYYIYTRLKSNQAQAKTHEIKVHASAFKNLDLIESLLDYCVQNYELSETIFVTHPDVSNEQKALLNLKIKNVLHLKPFKGGDWKFENDIHWTCKGHEVVATQISEYLAKNLSLKK